MVGGAIATPTLLSATAAAALTVPWCLAQTGLPVTGLLRRGRRTTETPAVIGFGVELAPSALPPAQPKESRYHAGADCHNRLVGRRAVCYTGAMKTCPVCGAENDTSARFCLECGELFDDVVAEPTDPWLGRMVAGRFRIIRKLGDGGMGEVYLAEQLPMGREIALKVLRQHLADDPQAVERFKREAQAASQLAHQHTIVVYDFGQDDDGTLFLAMEFLKGQPLDEVMAEGPMPPDRAAKILAHVCGSLEEAHERGMVHRDLKPENIFLTERGREQDYVKVLDFGIAKVTQSSKGDKLESITRAGAIFGTPQYMSPEQIRGDELDARSDVYALGVILYEMISDQLPFEARTVMELLTQHLNAAPAPIVRLPSPNDSALAALEAAALRALSKDPAQRQPSARAFLEDIMAAMPNLTLDSLIHTAPATAGAPAAVLDAPETQGSSLLVVLLAALVAAGAAGAFFFMGGVPGGDGSAGADFAPAAVADQDAPPAAADAKPAAEAAAEPAADAKPADAKPADAKPEAEKEITEEEAKKIEAEAEAEAKAAEEEEKAAEKGGELTEAEAKAIAEKAEAEAKAAEAEANAAASAVKAAEAAEKTKAAEEKASAAAAEKAAAEAAKAAADTAKAAADTAKAEAEAKAAEEKAKAAKSDADRKAAEEAKAAADAAKAAAETAQAEAEKAKAAAEAAAAAAKAETEKLKAEVEAAKAEAAAAKAQIEEAKQKAEEAKAKAKAAKKRKRAKANRGKIFIKSKTRGAKVYIDGKLRGRTPLKALRVKPGKHTVELRKGKKRKKRKVTVRAGRVLRVQFKKL